MNIIFTIMIVIIGVFGGLGILLKFGETDKSTLFYMPLLLLIVGGIFLVWGFINHLTGSYIYPTKTGGLPVSGLQQMGAALTLIIPSAVILKRNFNKKEK